jgi:hypothetical protein
MPVDTIIPVTDDTHRCPYCDRPFATTERVDLHVGLEHYEDCTSAEADAFEAAYTAETEAIRLYRLKAVGLLVACYFGTLIVYALVT